MGTIRQIPILLPPLEEQKRIVEELDERLSLIDVAETQIADNLLRATLLRQSILKHAFEGTLVPQDPTDEPAPQRAAGSPAVKAVDPVRKPQNEYFIRTSGRRTKSKKMERRGAE